ncbi:MAG: hypothetical protein IT529_19550 [Burkholderiales bacterium]|nr:hypothetical protein [Burkholderiales bacterium]
MEKLQRIKGALLGETLDRPPYGFWTHLPGIDLDPARLARETADFSMRYDMDFVKTMPNGLYSVEDWGCVCDYSEIASGGAARVTQPAIRNARDWETLAELPVTSGALGRELDHFARLTARVGAGVPVLATVFSPLSTAAKLSNGAQRQHIMKDGAALARGLETICRVTCAFARAAVERGCAGVFLAIQEANREALDATSYRSFGIPYDRRVLEAATGAGAWFNVVHLHGENVLTELLPQYDVAALNWHIGETPPSIRDYRAGGDNRAILGGLRRANLTRRDHAGIRADIARAMAESGGRGMLLAPACVIRHPVDEATLRFTAETIRNLHHSRP